MPHLSLEYSANLRSAGDLPALCRELAGVLAAQRDGAAPVYPLGGIRVRAIACDDYCIGDGAADLAFVHARLAVGAGRSDEVRRATGDALFASIKAHFARQYETQGLALSLEIAEFSESGTWKHNNLHARYRKA